MRILGEEDLRREKKMTIGMMRSKRRRMRNRKEMRDKRKARDQAWRDQRECKARKRKKTTTMTRKKCCLHTFFPFSL